MFYILFGGLVYWFLWLWQKNREAFVRYPLLKTLLTIGMILLLVLIWIIKYFFRMD